MNIENVRRLIQQLNLVLEEIDLEALRTPTGPDREQLTEAAIFLRQADGLLRPLV